MNKKTTFRPSEDDQFHEKTHFELIRCPRHKTRKDEVIY